MLEATYFDTADLDLAAHGVTLRRRSGGNDAGWHVKIPQGKDTRTEVRLPLGDGTTGPDRGRTACRTQCWHPVRALVRDRDLVPVARVSTRRLEHALLGEDGVVLAEVCDDQVHTERLHGPSLDQVWREWEVELVARRPVRARRRRAAAPRRRRHAGSHGLEARPQPRRRGARDPARAFREGAVPRQRGTGGAGLPGRARSPSCSGRTSGCAPTTPARSTSCASPRDGCGRRCKHVPAAVRPHRDRPRGRRAALAGGNAEPGARRPGAARTPARPGGRRAPGAGARTGDDPHRRRAARPPTGPGSTGRWRSSTAERYFRLLDSLDAAGALPAPDRRSRRPGPGGAPRAAAPRRQASASRRQGDLPLGGRPAARRRPARDPEEGQAPALRRRGGRPRPRRTRRDAGRLGQAGPADPGRAPGRRGGPAATSRVRRPGARSTARTGSRSAGSTPSSRRGPARPSASSTRPGGPDPARTCAAGHAGSPAPKSSASDDAAPGRWGDARR